MEVTDLSQYVCMTRETKIDRSVKATARIIDIENLCGGSGNVVEHHSKVRNIVSRNSGAGEMFTVVAAGVLSVKLCPDLLWDWQRNRFLIGHGVNGADNELIGVLNEPQIRRSSEIEIWSGDHCFTDATRTLVRLGLTVHVFSRPCALAESLRSVATRVTLLTELSVVNTGQFAMA